MDKKEYKKLHYQKNRDKYIQKARDWNRNNPDKRKLIVKKNNNKSKLRKRIWKEEKTFGGNKTLIGKLCELCGNNYRLAIHHKDGNNGKLGKVMNNDPKNLIVLCVRCHSAVHGWWGIKPL